LTADSDPTSDKFDGTALTSAPFLPIFRYSQGAPGSRQGIVATA
jgi:hypothetical protein